MPLTADLGSNNCGILCRHFESTDSSSSTAQIVPEALVLAELYEGALGGHLGADKTLARLKQGLYWPGHCSDVRE